MSLDEPGGDAPAFDPPAPGLRGPSAGSVLLPDGPRVLSIENSERRVGKKWRRAPWDATRTQPEAMCLGIVPRAPSAASRQYGRGRQGDDEERAG